MRIRCVFDEYKLTVNAAHVQIEVRRLEPLRNADWLSHATRWQVRPISPSAGPEPARPASRLCRSPLAGGAPQRRRLAPGIAGAGLRWPYRYRSTLDRSTARRRPRSPSIASPALDAPDLAAATGLCGFAAGLRQDVDAVRAAITQPSSNGLLEGQVNRPELIKRQMYGGAAMPLDRQYWIAGHWRAERRALKPTPCSMTQPLSAISRD